MLSLISDSGAALTVVDYDKVSSLAPLLSTTVLGPLAV